MRGRTDAAVWTALDRLVVGAVAALWTNRAGEQPLLALFFPLDVANHVLEPLNDGATRAPVVVHLRQVLLRECLVQYGDAHERGVDGEREDVPVEQGFADEPPDEPEPAPGEFRLGRTRRQRVREQPLGLPQVLRPLVAVLVRDPHHRGVVLRTELEGVSHLVVKLLRHRAAEAFLRGEENLEDALVPGVVAHQDIRIRQHAIPAHRHALPLERAEPPSAAAGPARGVAVAAADAAARASLLLHPRHRPARAKRGAVEVSQPSLEREKEPRAAEQRVRPRGQRTGGHGDGVIELRLELVRHAAVLPRGRSAHGAEPAVQRREKRHRRRRRARVAATLAFVP